MRSLVFDEWAQKRWLSRSDQRELNREITGVDSPGASTNLEGPVVLGQLVLPPILDDAKDALLDFEVFGLLQVDVPTRAR